MKFRPLSADCAPAERQHVFILIRDSVTVPVNKKHTVYPRILTAVAIHTDDVFGGRRFHGFTTCILRKEKEGLTGVSHGTTVVGPDVIQIVEAWAPIEVT